MAAGNSHGAKAIVRAVLSGTFAHESEGERLTAALFYDTEVELDFNVWVLPGIRVDALWKSARLIIEYDGRAHHTLPTDREWDEARDARLRAAGYAVVRISAADLRDPHAPRRRIPAAGNERRAGLFASA